MEDWINILIERAKRKKTKNFFYFYNLLTINLIIGWFCTGSKQAYAFQVCVNGQDI